MLGILDLRSLGYYKIKYGILQQNLSKCYHFESAEKLHEEFNLLINKRKKEERGIEKDQYPWLDDSDEKKIHDRQRDIRQTYGSRQFMLYKSIKGTSERYDL